MRTTFLATLLFAACFSAAQGQSGNMAGMDMSHASRPSQGQDQHDMPRMAGDGSAMAMNSMESHHMDMGPHMKMTLCARSSHGIRKRLIRLRGCAERC